MKIRRPRRAPPRGTEPSHAENILLAALSVTGRMDQELGRARRDQRRLLARLADPGLHPAASWRHCARLNAVNARIQALESLRPGDPPRPGEFLLSSWALRDSFRLCTETPDEGMHFIIGVKLLGLMVATGIAEFPYAERSIVRAIGQAASTHGLTIEAAETDHDILAIAHSHPGYGPEANHPSGTDLATHRLWERSRHLVGAIWSRDGFVRFFTAGRPFRVRVLGSHLEQVDTHVWKLREEYLGHDR